jgi:maltose O-acetyltransferase
MKNKKIAKEVDVSLLRYIVWRIMLLLPGNRLFRFRAALWRVVGFDVDTSALITNCARLLYGNIHVGRDTFIGAEVLITGGQIWIGDNCDIAPRVTIHAGSHKVGGTEHRAGECYGGSIRIGDGTWIGTGAILVDGANVGKGCIIAAGSVVIGDIPDDTLAAGVPARVKKTLAIAPVAGGVI